MGWNHRVVSNTERGETWYAIHEVYYNDQGKPDSMTETPVYPCGETKEELRKDLQRMLAALDKPALDYKTMEEER